MNKRFLTIPAVLLLSAICLLPSAFGQGGVKGKVRNNKGSGIANATVTARRDGEDVKTVRADSKGSFSMQGLEAGTYNVLFEADGFASGVKYAVKVSNGGIVDLGDRLILYVDQGSLIIIKGSVFYKEGTSLPAAKVEIERVNDDGTTKRLGTTQTSMTGEFTFRLQPGTTKIKVTAK